VLNALYDKRLIAIVQLQLPEPLMRDRVSDALVGIHALATCSSITCERQIRNVS